MLILMLGKQEGAFANLRDWRGTGLGFAGGRVAGCLVRNGLERRGRGEGDHGKLRWQVREWPEMMAWEGEEAQGQREQRTYRTRRGRCPQSCRQHRRPQTRGVRRRHGFG